MVAYNTLCTSDDVHVQSTNQIGVAEVHAEKSASAADLTLVG